MLTTELVIGSNTYKLRLNIENTIALQKKIGKNPIEIFSNLNGAQMPDITDMASVLFYSLQPYHNDEFKDISDVYALIDNYYDEGGDITSLIKVILEIYKVSGTIPKNSNIKNIMKK